MDSGILSRSKKELKKVRNIKIIELASQFSLDDIAYLYNIESATVSNILKQANKQAKVEKCSDVDRVTRNQKLDKTIRPFLYNSLKDEGFTEADIVYIHERSSEKQFVKKQLSETLLSIKSETEKATETSCEDSTLELTEEPISDAILARDAVIKATQENLGNALAEIDLEKGKNKRLCDELQNKDSRIVALEKELEAYKRKLKLEKEAYTEQESIYESKIDKLKEANSELRNSNTDLTQCMYAHSQRANAAELVNIDLQNRISELENSLNQQTEANLKLQSENEALKKEVETLESDFDKLAFSEDIKIEKIDSKYKKVFDREQIKSVYIDNDFCLKATYESLQNQFVYISYRHLQNILKEEGIYKHTYKVKKKRQKK